MFLISPCQPFQFPVLSLDFSNSFWVHSSVQFPSLSTLIFHHFTPPSNLKDLERCVHQILYTCWVKEETQLTPEEESTKILEYLEIRSRTTHPWPLFPVRIESDFKRLNHSNFKRLNHSSLPPIQKEICTSSTIPLSSFYRNNFFPKW